MKSAVKNLAYQTVAQLRLPRLLHRALFRNRLTIVMYHAVVQSPLEVYDDCFLDESSFRSQVKYLKKHFEVIPLSQAVERLRKGRVCRPTAAVTFDDGYQNSCDVAFPILRELGLPATIFLTTALVNTSDTLGFCRLNRALGKTSKPLLEWDGYRFDLSGSRLKAEAAYTIKGRLKEFAHTRLLAELRRIILELGDDPYCPIEVDSPYRMLSEKAIREMAASGLIEFGAHTHTHAILSRLSARERRNEIEQSVSTVQALTGRPCKLFSYPNGHRQDYDTEAIAFLEACGVRASVTAIAGPNDRMTPAMELRRYGVATYHSMAQFQLMVHHLIAQVQQMLRF